MTDIRRETVRSLILEWDPAEAPIHEHLGLTAGQWHAFGATGELPAAYEPRQPSEPEVLDVPARGRPPGRRIPAETRWKIHELHAAGHSQREIQRRLGVSQATVRNTVLKGPS